MTEITDETIKKKREEFIKDVQKTLKNLTTDKSSPANKESLLNRVRQNLGGNRQVKIGK